MGSVLGNAEGELGAGVGTLAFGKAGLGCMTGPVTKCLLSTGVVNPVERSVGTEVEPPPADVSCLFAGGDCP